MANCSNKKAISAQAAAILERLVKTDENNLEALKTIARIRAALGDKQKALDALRGSFFISPFDYKLHTQAGELSVDLKDNAQALTEFQVALALHPPNIAEANYNVATAYHSLGRPARSETFGVARARSRAALRESTGIVVENHRAVLSI